MLEKLNVQNPALLAAALEGLSRPQKSMSPKWFYDEDGSALFEDITDLPEYYPTRVETEILEAQSPALARIFEDVPALFELGSGASVKTRILLDALDGLQIYAPLDISSAFLQQTADALRQDYPRLEIVPVVGDFTQELVLPRRLAAVDKILFFPGSTIGNLERAGAQALLGRLARLANVNALILGTDLVKDREVLVRAYDDAAGVTAAFNKNLLARLNREAGAKFDLACFRHEARWNAHLQRIEMHLVSEIEQDVRVANTQVHFDAGESIHTENSHKFTRESLAGLARDAGWTVDEFWTDDADRFAVSILRPETDASI